MSKNRASIPMGDTPLTDPRSMVGSALFHALLLLTASLAFVSAADLIAEPTARPIRGELGPVDNRAPAPDDAGHGGGNPGENGGLNTVRITATDEQRNEVAARSDKVADALLSEILPSSLPRGQRTIHGALPGPRTLGQGVLPGPGLGGGGGKGGGHGGGVGRGIGPGTQFFGAREHAHSFAYVIDCSGSMATRNSLDIAKRELLASLDPLPADTQFTVIFYNIDAQMFSDAQGRTGLMPATPANKARVRTQLASVDADGLTDHMRALRAALQLKPEVVFFLTDADLMTNDEVNQILQVAGPTRIQAVEFGRGSAMGRQTPLHRLANATGGAYYYIDVGNFPTNSSGY